MWIPLRNIFKEQLVEDPLKKIMITFQLKTADSTLHRKCGLLKDTPE